MCSASFSAKSARRRPRRILRRASSPGQSRHPQIWKKSANNFLKSLKREPTDDDLYSYLMYPQVFTEFAKHAREFSDVSVLPTPTFFYGLRLGEEINITIEEGKSLIVRLVNLGETGQGRGGAR